MDCKYPLDCIKIIKQKLPIVRTFYIRAVGNFIKIKYNYFQFLSDTSAWWSKQPHGLQESHPHSRMQ